MQIGEYEGKRGGLETRSNKEEEESRGKVANTHTHKVTVLTCQTHSSW